MLDRLLALLEVGCRLLLQLLELRLRELEERAAGLRESVGGERLHRDLELAARLLDRDQAGRVLRAHDEIRRDGAEDEPYQESDDHWADER